MDDSQAGRSGFDVQDVLEILQRRWRPLAIGALAGLVLGLILWGALPRRYEASTSVLAEPQGVPDSYVRSTITADMSQRISTLQQRVTSYANLNNLIELIGRERLDPSGERATEDLMNEIRSNLGVSVEIAPGRSTGSTASVIELRYEGRSPDVLAEVVSGIADLFINESHKERIQQATATKDFLDRELARVEVDLSVQEKRIRDFRLEHLGALPEQLEGNNSELDRLNESLRYNLEAQETLSSKIGSLRMGGSDGASGAPGSSLASVLAEARKELIAARRIYTEDHPNVRALEAQVDELEQEVARQAEDEGAESQWVDPLRQRELASLNSTLDGRKREEQDLRARIAELERKVEETPRNEQMLLELTRGYDTLKETYALLLGKEHDASLSRNLEAAKMAEQFKVLRPPRKPDAPFSPNPMIVVPAGLAVGIGLALLLIVWAEFRTPAFHSVDTLARRVGLPILAAIPDLDRDRIYEGAPPPDSLDWRLVVSGAPNSAAAEQYRGFAPHFLAQKSCRVILVTSAQPGDGKSVTCANLAWILASDVGRRVLLIDADMRRGSQHRLFGVPRSPGLAEVVQGNANLTACVHRVTPTLSLLAAGSAIQNPVALLTSEAFVKLCEQASESYEVVMIDSPPILPVIDAKILRRMAEMVVFVVRAGISPSGGVIRSLQELKGAAGLVFNRVSAGSFRRYYYYDAYSHYEYSDQETASRPESGGEPSKLAKLLGRMRGSA